MRHGRPTDDTGKRVDTIETINGSVVQHGSHNDRIYLMHLNSKDVAGLLSKLDNLAMENGYGKIFAKVPATCWKAFRSAGYMQEAIVPGFFRGGTDGLFIAKFFSAQRRQAARRKPSGLNERPRSKAFRARRRPRPVEACTPTDAEQVGDVYRRVFETYPFPIHRPAHLQQMMENNALYYCIRVDHRIAAVAAAEIDALNRTCEMTDFATLPPHRGKGFAAMLLVRLDEQARHLGLRTAYTIARADSVGMNRVFEKMGYQFAGRLIKNSQIGGRIRSMAVWYKHIRHPD